MKVLRWTLRLHKWLALLVAVQVLFWFVGGLVMSALPIHEVRGEHKIAHIEAAPAKPAALISLEQAAAAADLSSVQSAALVWRYDNWLWEIRGPDDDLRVINARTGRLNTGIDESEARRIARLDFNGSAEIASVTLLDDAPGEYKRALPVWQVIFDDRDKSTLYIDPRTTAVTGRRSNTWRVFDVMWKLHVMDWDDGEDINHPWLVGFAFIALIVALAGCVLLFIRIRRLLLRRRRT